MSNFFCCFRTHPPTTAQPSPVIVQPLNKMNERNNEIQLVGQQPEGIHGAERLQLSLGMVDAVRAASVSPSDPIQKAVQDSIKIESDLKNLKGQIPINLIKALINLHDDISSLDVASQKDAEKNLKGLEQIEKNVTTFQTAIPSASKADQHQVYWEVIENKIQGIKVAIAHAKVRIPQQKKETIRQILLNTVSTLKAVIQTLTQFSPTGLESLQQQIDQIDQIIDRQGLTTKLHEVKQQISLFQQQIQQIDLQQRKSAIYSFTGALKDYVSGAENLYTLVSSTANIYWRDGLADVIALQIEAHFTNPDILDKVLNFYFAVQMSASGAIPIAVNLHLAEILKNRFEQLKRPFLNSIQIIPISPGHNIGVYKGFPLEHIGVITDNNSHPDAVKSFASSLNVAKDSKAQMDSMKAIMKSRLITDEDIYKKFNVRVVLPTFPTNVDTQKDFFPIPLAIYQDNLKVLDNTWLSFVKDPSFSNTSIFSENNVKTNGFTFGASSVALFTEQNLSQADIKNYTKSRWVVGPHLYAQPQLTANGSIDVIDTGSTFNEFVTYIAFFQAYPSCVFSLTQSDDPFVGGIANSSSVYIATENAKTQIKNDIDSFHINMRF